VLAALERGERGSEATRLTEDLPLFSTTVAPVEPEKINPMVAQIKATEPDTLTPLEALEILYKLKEAAEREP